MTDLSSLKQVKKCIKCEIKIKKLFVNGKTIDINEIENLDFKEAFLNFILHIFGEKVVTCKTRKSTVQIMKITESYLFFDSEIFQLNKIVYPNGISLRNLTKKLILKTRFTF